MNDTQCLAQGLLMTPLPLVLALLIGALTVGLVACRTIFVDRTRADCAEQQLRAVLVAMENLCSQPECPQSAQLIKCYIDRALENSQSNTAYREILDLNNRDSAIIKLKNRESSIFERGFKSGTEHT